MSAPYALHVDRTTIAGRVLLRAASSVNNLGSGPLELRAYRRGAGAWIVEQAIYDRYGRRHLFATNAQLVFKYVPGYRYDHPAVGDYSYWKFRHVAAFELWSIDARFHAVRLALAGQPGLSGMQPEPRTADGHPRHVGRVVGCLSV
jgi:hypothetical protein